MNINLVSSKILPSNKLKVVITYIISVTIYSLVMRERWAEKLDEEQLLTEY